MREYLGHPAFWLSVVVVAVIVNFLWMKLMGKGGKLV